MKSHLSWLIAGVRLLAGLTWRTRENSHFALLLIRNWDSHQHGSPPKTLPLFLLSLSWKHSSLLQRQTTFAAAASLTSPQLPLAPHTVFPSDLAFYIAATFVVQVKVSLLCAFLLHLSAAHSTTQEVIQVCVWLFTKDFFISLIKGKIFNVSSVDYDQQQHILGCVWRNFSNVWYDLRLLLHLQVFCIELQ